MTAVHLLLDFGEVVSVAQPAAEVAVLAALAGLPMAEFTTRYWAHRASYDAGGTALTYWTRVLGAVPEPARLRQLIDLDVLSWSHLNPEVLRLLDAVHAAGNPVSLLSNAPRELARALERQDRLRPFRHLLFSADLAVAKPDPRCYETALATLDAEPGEVVFVDDRPANIAAAAALGIPGIVFTPTADCLATLARALHL